ncbi:hypothetical protein E2C01_014731 [Portunus trituberculatus]|uniref:Uncharacterized protein n=1 Tax=Portunus trituberculatus TaxID=210409 RepID=A0A5B7DL93_PORTR|nr:hypothetical protein [Portunus trituberculatus]
MPVRFVTLVVVVSVVCVWGTLSGDLRLVNNGYEGLLVTITDEVPQQHCNHVVQGLKHCMPQTPVSA